MRTLAVLLLLAAFTACEKKPTAEEVQAQEEAKLAAVRPTPAPTPKPGEWMYKNYKNPLDKGPTKH